MRFSYCLKVACCDIIIERWVPYGAQSKRRTIVQRAAAAAQYAAPRNVIIQYEAVQVRVVRQFQRLGVVQANPQAYLQQYGAQLLDASTLVQRARSAGVVEDISAPAGASVGFSANSYGQESSFGVSSGLAGGAGASGAEFVSGGAGGSEAGFGGSSFESSNFSSGGGAGFEGGFAAGGGGGFGGSSFESSSFSSGGAGGASGVFQQVDASRDGRFDFNESGNFVGQNLGGGSSQESYSSSFSY
ncbi:unnamed protein product [Rotaria socialis]